MVQEKPSPDHIAGLRRFLPHLRRYARALLCDQAVGDDLAIQALERIVNNPQRLAQTKDVKTLLFLAFHEVLADCSSLNGETVSELSGDERQALLLCGMEEFPIPKASKIMGRSETEIESLLVAARQNAKAATEGKVLVIEDELIIALDLEKILTGLGHRSIGIARTHKEAIAFILKARPELILADIHLADASSGLDAVNEILERISDIPVVFITAYPEMLLTGTRPEPSFLIPKPYTSSHVEAAISQAMLFARKSE